MATIPVRWNGKDSKGNPLRWGSPDFVWNGTIQSNPKTNKPMPILHVLIGFDSLTDHDVEETAGAVSTGFYGNAEYPNPPATLPTKVVFDAALHAFSESIPVAKHGGPADTADKNNKRAALIELLRQIAAYVQANHGNDLASLLSTGFKAGSTNRTQSALPAPIISGIKNGISGQLLPQIGPIANAAGYESRFAAIGAGGVPGPWQTGPYAPNTRALAINGLTPGVVYSVQVRALGGSTNYSDWSDPVQHMCM